MERGKIISNCNIEWKRYMQLNYGINGESRWSLFNIECRFYLGWI